MTTPVVIRQLLNSEKAVAAGVLVIASMILLLLDRITAEQWMNYTQVLLGVYVSGKTIQGAATVLARRSSSDDDPDDTNEVAAAT
jgi:hypothetical protein